MLGKNILSRLVFVVVAASLCVTAQVESQETIPEGLIEAANREIHKLLKINTREELEEFNFLLSDDLEKVSFGDPYPRYKLEMEKVRQMEETDSFKKVLTFIGWEFPVLIDNQPRTLLKMSKVEGEWVWGTFGGNPKPITYARMKWKESEGYRHSYIASHSDGPEMALIMIEKDGHVQLYPLFSRNERLLGIKPDVNGNYPLLSTKHVIERLKKWPVMYFDSQFE